MSERSERVAEALWRHDGYDLNADPTSRTAQEWRPEYMARAAAVLDALGDDPAQATEERVYAEGAYHAMWSFFLRLPHSPMSDAVQREAMRLRAALDPETGP